MNRKQAALLPSTEGGVSFAAERLIAGDLVVMPTETVYGLAARADSPDAVSSVYAVKQRPLFDPLIVHVARGDGSEPLLARIRPLVDFRSFSQEALDLLEVLGESFWPGPLTLVLPRAETVHDLVTAGLPGVAVRMPAHPVAERLIRAVGVPLVAPSANRFGRISPTTAQAAMEELGDRVPAILDGGPCAIGLESTVIAIEPDATVRLLRPGGIPTEAIAAIAGALSPRSARVEAPGQLPSHYAPRAPVCLLQDLDPAKIEPAGPVAILLARGPAEPVIAAFERAGHEVLAARVLSPTGDDREAARNLFAAMRSLDAASPSRIFAEPWTSQTGLGAAISDRLARASAPR